ncbi:DedA family protein [Pediococcus acidilactici]|uniref:DedA family protein n=1 Tax=Pediococcus acidilactici TaxID=1254 RepID=UPI0013217628|nr:DedA family protein [Pediococcus acidilactici]KAF0364325.1 DedA family protein [Pediococcus acidilactici]KAF0368401.1 DedA family protein [Pediococcus acidilactici]KAF0420094.1 DedA family protein [Pediococcus acidilactici]KAF0424280.1 DedA family protein [Pediococcus acidilactici]KAF0474373.1 DedA family protein [Pediococcus acidilactici]
MEQQITQFINDFGYLAIVLLIALENLLPPIPSEIILTFTGFMTLTSKLTLWGSVIAATVGAVIGALLLYVIGRYLNPERLHWLVASRLGRGLRLKDSDITKAQSFFQRHGFKTIFFGRFVPVIRSLISIPAGMAKMPGLLFVLLTTVATLIWNLVLILLGRAAGSAWAEVSAMVDTYASVVAILLAGILLIGGLVYYFKRIRTNA